MSYHKFDELGRIVVTTFSHPILKTITGLCVAFFATLFDVELKQAMFALFILCMFDFVTGIMAVRSEPGALITSKKLWGTGAKIGVYFMLVSAGYLSEQATSNALDFLDETIIGFFGCTEFLSIMENTGKMGYPTPQKLIKKISNYRDNK